MKHFALLLIAFTLSLSACGPNSTPLVPGAEQTKDEFTPLPGPGDFAGAKTTLPFSGVSWPAVVSIAERAAFAIGLNLSGSFEGNSGWSNLTNNFDGQGLSMGLLNQTLGTGSLQPLLIAMQNQFPQRISALFSAANYQSLNAMLKAFQATLPQLVATRNLASAAASTVLGTGDELPGAPLSALDYEAEGLVISAETLHSNAASEIASPTSASVQWAVATLYAGTQFKPDWKVQLNALGNDPNYISIQIQAASRLFTLARKYQAQLGLLDFRSFLFFFDIAVQNGSLYAADVTDFLAWRKQSGGVFECGDAAVRNADAPPKTCSSPVCRRCALSQTFSYFGTWHSSRGRSRLRRRIWRPA